MRILYDLCRTGCYLGAHAKFQIPTICHYWGLATAATRSRKEEEKEISASADGGPRSRVCARETLRSAPHRH